MPCDNMCEGEKCIMGDGTNYYYGYCQEGYGCTAENQTDPTVGVCSKLPTCANWTDGCYCNETCSNICAGGCCGANCPRYWYSNETGTVYATEVGVYTCESSLICMETMNQQ